MSTVETQHVRWLRQALCCARNAEAKLTNFRVGCVIVDPEADELVVDGFTGAEEGNTHAEQSCLIRMAKKMSTDEMRSLPAGNDDRPKGFITRELDLYTTMEPCWHRLSGNVSCADLIAALGPATVPSTNESSTSSGSRKSFIIRRVFYGVPEPDTFVGENVGRGTKKLKQAGVECVLVRATGLEKEILEIAKTGHRSNILKV